MTTPTRRAPWLMAMLLPMAATVALTGCDSNVAPNTPAVAIGPDGATTLDDLVLELDGEATDEDGDSVGLIVNWTVDGTLRGDLENQRSVPSSQTAKGQVWTVEVVSTDGNDAGNAQTATLTVSNAAPSAEITDLPFAPDAADDVLVRAEGFDPDDDAVSLSWSWTVDGVDAGITGPVVPADRTARGQVWEVTVVANDGEEDGEPVSGVIDINNRRPVVQNVTLTPSRAFEDTVLTASAVAYDPDGDAVGITWTWYVNGVEIQSGEVNTLDGASFDRNQAVVAVATPNDGFADGEPLASSAVEIQNSPPTLASVTIDQAAVVEGTDITCSYDGFFDADGDDEDVRLTWEVSGRLAAEGPTLSGAYFERGDQIVCVATPTDGFDDGRAVRSAPVRVQNTVPTVGSVTIGPVDPAEGDIIEATVTDIADDDGDVVALRYAWSVNGSVVSTESTLSSSLFDKGDTISLSITPFDGLDAGVAVVSNDLSAVNTAPVIDSVTLSPVEVATDGTLTATVSASDIDGDALTYIYTWTVSGSVVSGETGPTLSGDNFVKLDEVSVSVVANDGAASSDAVASDLVEVINTAPSFTGVSISPSDAFEATTLNCVTTGWSDLDGDDENYTYDWQVNGASVATTATLGGAFFDRGDSVVCVATADDLDDVGNTLTSDAVVIQNTVPTLDGVTLSDTSPFVGDVLTATAGSTDDEDGDTVSVSYAWTIDGVDAGTGDTLDLSGVAKGAVIVVTATPNDGTDDGDASTATATLANTAPEVSSVTLSPSTVKVGDTLTASVTADDADGDALSYTYAWFVDGSEVAGETGATLSTGFVGGQEVYVTVVANDGDVDSASVDSATVTVDNTAPSLASASLDLTVVREGDTVTCVPDGFEDVDGDSPVYAYLWSNGETTASIDSTTFAKGDSLSCTVTPGDGMDQGDSVTSESVAVSNTAPVLASLTLPADVTVLADVEPTVGATTDADGDTVTLSYAWTVDGADAGSGMTLSFEDFAKGDEIVLTVTPNDGDEDGAPVTASVVVGNVAPVLTSVSLTPEDALTTDDLVASYDASDDDVDDTLVASYVWTVNGSEVSGETTDTLASSNFVKGDEVTVTVTVDDGTDTVRLTSSTVTIGNSAPVLSSVTLSPDGPGANDDITATALATDGDGDTLTTTYVWTVNGSEISGVTGDTLASSNFVKGDDIVATATVTDGTASVSLVSSTVTIGNSLPRVTSLSLAPTSPTTEDDVVASITTDDTDGDTVTVTYAWTVNGSAIDGETTATLSSAFFVKGDTVEVTATADDGTDSVTSTASVTVGNVAPEVTFVSLSPSSPKTGDDLTAMATADDVDGADTVTFSYAWAVNGVTVSGATGTTLASSNFVKGDEVEVTVTADDGTATDSDVASVTIGNTAPEAAVLAIADVEDNQDVVCEITTAATDVDGDSLGYTVTWTVDGAEYTGTATTTDITGDTVPSADTTPGEIWECTVVASDGTDDSGAATADVEIGYCTVIIEATDSVSIDYIGMVTSTDMYFSFEDTVADEVAWFQFDLTSIDDSATVRSASLSVYEDGGGIDGVTADVAVSDEDGWDSGTVTDADLTVGTTVTRSSVTSFTTDAFNDFDLDVSTWTYADDLTDNEVSFGVYTDTELGIGLLAGAGATDKEPYLTVILESCD